MTTTKKEETLEYETISDINPSTLSDEVAIELILDNENYHIANIIAMSISDTTKNYYVEKENVLKILDKIKDKKIICYDAKKIICNTKIKINCIDDIMIMAYLLNLNIKDDLAYLANQNNEDYKYYDNMKYSEMSKVLSTSEGALKASYHLAVKKITDFFNRKD